MNLRFERNCLPCTACCEGWVNVQGPVANAHLGSPCKHCTSQGCDIYAARPQEPCRSFLCAWRQEADVLPYEMRPDLCGAIVMFDQLDWQDAPVIVATATGAHLPEATQHWLLEASRTSGHPLLMIEYMQENGIFNGAFDLKMVGSEAFKAEMVRHFERGGFDRTPLGKQLHLMSASV